MGISATSIVNEFAVRPDLLRRAVAQHRSWIEQQLGDVYKRQGVYEKLEPVLPQRRHHRP